MIAQVPIRDYGYIGKPPVDWERWVRHARFTLFVEVVFCYSLWLLEVI